MLRKYLDNRKQAILGGEKVHSCRNGPARHLFNRTVRALRGGAYLGNGTMKCVVTHDTKTPCEDSSKNLVAGPDTVKVLLPKYELVSEIKSSAQLTTPQPGHDGTMGRALDPAFVAKTFNILTKDTPACQSGFRYTPECVAHNNDWRHESTFMAAAVLPKAINFVRADQHGREKWVDPGVFVEYALDVAHTLWRMSLNNLFHGDVKSDNLMIQRDRGVLIDLGWTTPYHILHKYGSVSGRMADGQTFVETPYRYWPVAIRAVLNNLEAHADNREMEEHVEYSRAIAAKATADEAADVFRSVDKHGFAVTMIELARARLSAYARDNGLASPWDLFKTPSGKYGDWFHLDSAGRFPVYVRDYAGAQLAGFTTITGTLHGHDSHGNYRVDPEPDRTFAAWPHIYKTMLDVFQSDATRRPATLTANYWDEVDAILAAAGREKRARIAEAQAANLADESARPGSAFDNLFLNETPGSPVRSSPGFSPGTQAEIDATLNGIPTPDTPSLDLSPGTQADVDAFLDAPSPSPL